MKYLVVYSSRTGNTKKVAEAIYQIVPEEKSISPVENAPDPSDYDFIAVGYWVDKGDVDTAAKSYMEKLNGQTVGLFFTLGAYPDSEHAEKAAERGRELCHKANVIGTFICHGKVDPKLIKQVGIL